MFEKRNHLRDPMIELVCPYCSRDLYPFKSIDRFEIVLVSLDDLKRSFIKIRCFSCKRIFQERKFKHTEWLKHYRPEFIDQSEEQKMFKITQMTLETFKSGSEKN